MAQFIRNKNCYVSPHKQGTKPWLDERIDLITGSRDGSIILYSNTKEKKIELANKICGVTPDLIKEEHKEKVQFGTDNEGGIRDHFQRTKRLKVHELGLCKLIENPTIFGASVDGILENGDIIEIKTTSKPTPTKQHTNYSEIPEGHMFQMQHGMAVLHARNCHYYSYSRHDGKYYYRIVPFDSNKWNYIKRILIKFYNEYMLPIISSRTIQDTISDSTKTESDTQEIITQCEEVGTVSTATKTDSNTKETITQCEEIESSLTDLKTVLNTQETITDCEEVGPVLNANDLNPFEDKLIPRDVYVTDAITLMKLNHEESNEVIITRERLHSVDKLNHDERPKFFESTHVFQLEIK